ncbi:MAG: ATPase, T2SS/T4P/T4SS family [Microthrixaceae bacterium]
MSEALPHSAAGRGADVRHAQLVDDVIRRLHESTAASSDDEIRAAIRRSSPLLGRSEIDRVVAAVDSRRAGLAPIQHLLDDPTVTDVLINGPGPVLVERFGVIETTETRLDDEVLHTMVERTFQQAGLAIDRSHPIGDARLAGGQRISAVLPPLVEGGPHIAVRCFRRRSFEPRDFGDPTAVSLVSEAVRRRANVVVFGATGSGKTSLLAAMANTVDPTERLVVIEDAPELPVAHPHTVRLRAHPGNVDGAGRVRIRELVRAALRLRPDRLIVGEVRGAEALDMIWALATGHDGSWSTCHARSAHDAVNRLETFVMLADAALPLKAARRQVLDGIDVFVGMERSGGVRRIRSVDSVDRSGPEPRLAKWFREVDAPSGGARG